MLDLGWQEFMMVAIVLILVVGPKDLPRMLRSFSRAMRKAKSMASEFTSSLENVANESDMKQILQDVKTGEFDDIANLIDDEVEDVKKSSGIDDIPQDIQSIQGDVAKSTEVKAKSPKAKSSSKKPAKKAKTAAKKTAKKAAGQRKVAKKAAKKG